MRKVIVSNLASLDGFFETLDKKLDWCVTDEEFFAYAREMLRAADTLLFGRTTYELMANYWPTAPSDEIADKMNNLPKLVFSRTLQEVEWNNSRLAKSGPQEEVSKLKSQSGKDLVSPRQRYRSHRPCCKRDWSMNIGLFFNLFCWAAAAPCSKT